MKYEFFIAGRTRNKDNILKLCEIFDKYNIDYYCFLKNDESHEKAGLDLSGDINKFQDSFEALDLNSEQVKIIFENDLNGLNESKNLLLVLPAGKSAHIESGIAYGQGKKCYAIGEYDATDSLYRIFENIFKNEEELEDFLKNYK